MSGDVINYGTPAETKISVGGIEIAADIYLGVSIKSQEFDDPLEFTAYLGKTLSLKITPNGEIVDSSRKLEFIGPVTEVRLDHGINQINTVVVTATSPTIALDAKFSVPDSIVRE